MLKKGAKKSKLCFEGLPWVCIGLVASNAVRREAPKAMNWSKSMSMACLVMEIEFGLGED